MSRLHSRAALAAASLLCIGLATPCVARAQSLRGSHAKVERAYAYAKRRGLEFNDTRGEVTRGIEDGEYVPLRSGTNYRLRGVAVPYVRPATRAFLVELAAKYRKACRAPLVVTSAMRPTTLQRTLRNGVEKSVHPTGMAVDLRAPSGSCRPWLRRELLASARDGTVDATEERHPAHFHIIVFRARNQAN